MLQRSSLRTHRSAFTLVELMVVILIISILSALLTVAVTKGIGAAKRTRNMVDIRQLANAIDAFKAFYKVEYIPSSIHLSETGNYNIGVPSDAESLAYLQRLWPRLQFPVDWNGSRAIETNSLNNPLQYSGEMVLEGDQCLVFFLGGIPAIDGASLAPTCTGFSSDPKNPAAHLRPGGAVAKPPFFEFDSNRLVYVKHINSAGFMPSYLDTYGTSTDGKGGWDPHSGRPYLYFSAFQGIRNNYNHYAGPTFSECNVFDPDMPTTGLPVPKFLPVFPYIQGTGVLNKGQFYNPSGCQIISAGADFKYGQGGSPNSQTGSVVWTPATAANSAALTSGFTVYPGVFGADDQTNFYDSLMGTQTTN
jgi:prepilin-type N-terminal cleavage/methylation domain-containing protein